MASRSATAKPTSRESGWLPGALPLPPRRWHARALLVCCSPPEQIALHALHHQFALLIVNGGGKRQHARGALWFELAHLELGIKRVADVDGPQKARGLLNEAQQGILHQQRKEPCSRGRLDQ